MTSSKPEKSIVTPLALSKAQEMLTEDPGEVSGAVSHSLGTNVTSESRQDVSQPWS